MSISELLAGLGKLRELAPQGIKLARLKPVTANVTSSRVQGSQALWQKIDALQAGCPGWLLGTSSRISSLARDPDWLEKLRGKPLLHGEFVTETCSVSLRHLGGSEWLWTELVVREAAVDSATHLATEYRALLADHEGQAATYVRLHRLDPESGALQVQLSGFSGFVSTKNAAAKGEATP